VFFVFFLPLGTRAIVLFELLFEMHFCCGRVSMVLDEDGI